MDIDMVLEQEYDFNDEPTLMAFLEKVPRVYINADTYEYYADSEYFLYVSVISIALF